MSHKEQLSFEKTELYFTDEDQKRKKGRAPSEQTGLLSDDPIDENLPEWESKESLRDCLRNPRSWMRHIKGQVTRERIKIGIVLVFVLAAAGMFCFSKEEDGELLSLRGVSHLHPLVRPHWHTLNNS